MFLPELSFAGVKLHDEELFLGPNVELTRVLLQDNPVYLDLVLPGATRPKVRICFPMVGTTRVYAEEVINDANLVGDFSESFNRRTNRPYTTVDYRFGMELKVMMFFCWLDEALHQDRQDKYNIANYIILNCSSGHSGVLIRAIRGTDQTPISEKRVEIFYFDTGNDYAFAAKWRGHPNTKLIARFVPEGAGTAELRWVSQPL